MLPILINSSERHIKKLSSEIKTLYPDHDNFLYDSGRTALYQLLKSYLELSPSLKDKEVILAGHTCLVVINSILKANLKPVFADFKKETYQMDPQSIAKQITPDTKFIILQHTFGQTEKINEIKALAQQHNLIVIEDLAHSFLSKHNQKLLGNFSDSAFLSFGSNKILSCLRGGAAITKNSELSKLLQQDYESLEQFPTGQTYKHHLKQVGFYLGQSTYFFLKIGKVFMALLAKLRLAPKVISISEKQSWTSRIKPYKISDSLAHVCLKQFKRIPENTHNRTTLASQYENGLQAIPEVKTFSTNSSQVQLFFPILVPDPIRLQSVLKRYNVILNLDWTGSPISPNIKSLQKYNYNPTETPFANHNAKHLLLLPLHQNMTSYKAKKIIYLIKKYYDTHRQS
jgi:dTDP-4-amino-4,6-dideoxygalactose transaminase